VVALPEEPSATIVVYSWVSFLAPVSTRRAYVNKMSRSVTSPLHHTYSLSKVNIIRIERNLGVQPV